MRDDIIYILVNEAMPGYVKIGRTSDLEQRIRSLDTTSVPLPFECVYACRVKDVIAVERNLHDAFLDHRVRSNREFFEISADRVISALKLAEMENLTPKRDFVETQEDQQALDQARKRRSVFNFKMVDIPIGAELTFVNDDNIKAKVIAPKGQKTIEFGGELTSPSAAAQKLLGYPYQVQGTIYWLYQGETLDDRRRRMESE